MENQLLRHGLNPEEKNKFQTSLIPVWPCRSLIEHSAEKPQSQPLHRQETPFYSNKIHVKLDQIVKYLSLLISFYFISADLFTSFSKLI